MFVPARIKTQSDTRTHITTRFIPKGGRQVTIHYVYVARLLLAILGYKLNCILDSDKFLAHRLKYTVKKLRNVILNSTPHGA